MKICIEIPGSMRDGLWSAERGESRWCQNWARFLASQGHDVVCIGNPGAWGACPVVPNVTIKNRQDRKELFDIYIDAAWWRNRYLGNQLQKARLYIHHHYGFEFDILNDKSHIGPNHVISYAYTQAHDNFIGDHNIHRDKTFCLPIPLADKFGDSHFDSTELSYSAKEVFLDRHAGAGDNWYRCGAHVIEAMKLAHDMYGYKCNFFPYEQIDPKKHSAVTRLGVDKILDSISSKQFFNEMPYGYLLELLNKTKMTFPVISPGGSMIESIALGVLPLTWDGSPLSSVAKKEGWLLNQGSSRQEIINNMNLALSSRDFYDKMIALYQKELESHLYKNSEMYFKQVTDWMEKNCK